MATATSTLTTFGRVHRPSRASFKACCCTTGLSSIKVLSVFIQKEMKEGELSVPLQSYALQAFLGPTHWAFAEPIVRARLCGIPLGLLLDTHCASRFLLSMSANVPKIKLRLSEAALAAPSTTPSMPVEQPSSQGRSVASKRKAASTTAPARGKGKAAVATGKKKSLLSSVASSPVKSDLSEASSAAATIATSGHDNPASSVTAQLDAAAGATGKSATTSKRKLPSTLADSAAGLFGDYLTALQAARAYTLRRAWRLQGVTLKNANGYELGGLTEWVTRQPASVIAERSKSVVDAAGSSLSSPQRKQRSSGNRRQQSYDVFDIASIANGGSGGNAGSGAGEERGTFVCTHEGCHQIFNDRIRWRRHQNGHIRHHNRTKHQLAQNSSQAS